MIFKRNFPLIQRLFFSALLLVHFSPLFAQKTEKNAVLSTELSRFSAMEKRDIMSLEVMLHPDLVYVHSNTLRENKAEHLSAIATEKLVYEKIERLKVDLRRYGKTALTTGEAAVKGKLNGNNFEILLVYTAVYRKHKGRWQLLHWQSTRKP